VFWPEDFLGDDFPNARVLTFGYDTKHEQMFSAKSVHFDEAIAERFWWMRERLAY
jgi:hypothetical protein